ncbi:MAG: cobalt-precorrin-7 (C(5))-methyltransferase, partial [Sulfolobaceae archaeon]
MIYIVGVGPGDPELITIKAKKVIEDSEVVAGWESVLNRFNEMFKNKKIIKLTYNNQIEELEKIMKIAKDGKVVSILNHGDPTVSDWQFLEKIKKLANEHNVKVEVVSGVSSINIVLAREGLDLAHCALVSLHVRGEVNLLEIKKLLEIGRIVIVIPKPNPKGPQELAKDLIRLGLSNKKVIVYEKVTYNDERRREYVLYSLAT